MPSDEEWNVLAANSSGTSSGGAAAGPKVAVIGDEKSAPFIKCMPLGDPNELNAQFSCTLRLK